MAEDQRKAELTADLARARSRIAQNFGALRSDLDLPGRLKAGIAKSPIAWIGGATLVGVLLSKLPARRRNAVIKRDGSAAKVVSAGKTGLLLGALKIAFDLSRPVLVKWVSRHVADYVDGAGNERRHSR
jgi:hypothetical protein